LHDPVLYYPNWLFFLQENFSNMTMSEELESMLRARFNRDELISYLENDLNAFDTAVNIALSDEQPQAWRATWLIGQCIKQDDHRVKKAVKKVIPLLSNKDDGHLREWLKIIEKSKLSERQEGEIFDLCVTIWELIDKSPSVRIVALRFLVKIVKKYPELVEEIKYLFQDHYTETLSPGINNSFYKLKKELFK